MNKFTRLSFLLLLLPITAAAAQTNISNTDKYSWGANIGWINWQGDVTHGALIANKFVSGFIYSANVGWINLGDGTPTNGTQYSNTSTSDFGVNVDSTSDPNYYILTGYAYGANVGWINFNVQTQAGKDNQPRIEKTTGIFKGSAWGANIGWLPLESPGMAVVKTSFGINMIQNWTLY